MSLYHKYRPHSLDEMYGNEQTIATLIGLMQDQSTCPHVYLFHGPTGCGKTTLARIIASQLGIKGFDYKEIDSADFRGIDTVRAIRQQAYLAPIESPYRLWVIDECHKMTNDAQNALLKILEDTPEHVYFVLCTTEPQKLLKTVRGRCSELQVSPLSDRNMLRLLRRVAKAEEAIFGDRITKEVYDQIIQDSLGLPRNALQILEQVMSVPGDQRLAIAQKAAEEQSQSIELCRALIKREGWTKIANILKSLKDQDPENIRRHILSYCNSVLLSNDDEHTGIVMEQFIEPFYNTGWPGLTFACYAAIK